jgi:hypothetical protein
MSFRALPLKTGSSIERRTRETDPAASLSDLPSVDQEDPIREIFQLLM